MSNRFSAGVNQRLFYCALQLEALQALPDAVDARSRALLQAQIESLLFHLVRLYRSYLLELAESLQLPASGYACAQQLFTALAPRGSVLVDELCLHEREGNWLGHLLAAYEAIDAPQAPVVVVRSQAEIPLNNLPVDAGDDCQLSVETLLADYLRLRQMVERQRESMQEY